MMSKFPDDGCVIRVTMSVAPLCKLSANIIVIGLYSSCFFHGKFVRRTKKPIYTLVSTAIGRTFPDRSGQLIGELPGTASPWLLNVELTA